LEEEDDSALVARAVDGDSRAFRLLVVRHQARAFRTALSILKHEEDARDVAQDAFVKIFTKLDSFRGQAAFTTWLHRIVSNLCIDRIRRAKRRREVEYDDGRATGSQDTVRGPTLATLYLDGPGRALERSELREHMGSALASLSEAHRDILVMREVEGLSYEELAETLGVAKGTVMSRLFHARKNFAAAISGYLQRT
jgi:RNA polymerase sigma-70 factor (ECF subfamily)